MPRDDNKVATAAVDSCPEGGEPVPAPTGREVASSREIKLALLKHIGIPATHVCDVELDLTDVIAMVKVTILVPAYVNGLIATEIEQYDLVRRSPEGQG